MHRAGERGVLAAPASIGHLLREHRGDAGGRNERHVVGLAGAGSRQWSLLIPSE